jgi:YD repeat-containing protein
MPPSTEIDPMLRPARLPHLVRQITQHGRVVWYVRIGQGKRTRITTAFGSPEFITEYQAALQGAPVANKSDGSSVGSLAWLLQRYRETAEWEHLSEATRRQRDNIFVHIIETAGGTQASKVTAASIQAGKDRRAATPAQARNFLDAMRGLFRWAVAAKHVKIDPTLGVANPPRKKGDGFIAWTEADVARYQERWVLGTRQRVWLDVLLYSGLRRGDAVRYGRQHVRDGVGRIKTEKSGETVIAVLPMLPVLTATLAAGPCGDLTFIAGEGGQPLTKESFGNLFRQACNAAGVAGSAHGVRKIAATTAANNGATTAQLKALFGWTSDQMAEIYTRTADRDRLGRAAGHTLGNADRDQNDLATKSPSPSVEVRDLDLKTQ